MFFAILAKEIIEKKLCKKITQKCRKNSKNNNFNQIPDLEIKNGQEGLRKVRKRPKSNKNFSCKLKH